LSCTLTSPHRRLEDCQQGRAKSGGQQKRKLLITVCIVHLIFDHLFFLTVSRHIEAVKKGEKEKNFNEREGAYVKALRWFASGDLLKATDELIAIVMKYPLGGQIGGCGL